MQFRTIIPIPKSNFPLDYHSKVISLGSCFAVNIAEKLDYFKFHNSCNPFGIIFNPISLEKIISRGVQKEYFTEKDVFFHNDLWHCYEVHSVLSHQDKECFLTSLNTLVDSFYLGIVSASHLMITYGTSWVYRHIEGSQIVANCHKVPQKQFVKELLSIATIECSIQNTIAIIQKVNPNCNFIFTVSPVRHIKDGFVENQVSKAHLIAAIHKTYNSQLLTHNYFPSYEIMMDELRDYRFYADDMLHPNATAIDYIWERYITSWLTNKALETMDKVDSIQKSLAHRAFNPNTESHQQFVAKLQNKIALLQKEFPQIQF